jgi:hypothetical protein
MLLRVEFGRSWLRCVRKLGFEVGKFRAQAGERGFVHGNEWLHLLLEVIGVFAGAVKLNESVDLGKLFVLLAG